MDWKGKNRWGKHVVIPLVLKLNSMNATERSYSIINKKGKCCLNLCCFGSVFQHSGFGIKPQC